MIFVDTMFFNGHMNIYLLAEDYLFGPVLDDGFGDYSVNSSRNWLTLSNCRSFFLLFATI